MGRFACVLVGVALLIGQAGASCVGDCTGDGTVSFAELLQGVDIALGDPSAGACSGLDRGDAVVAVDDLVAAVESARASCGGSFAGDYAATVTFDASHTGIINLTADADGEVSGSILITTTARKFQPRISFNFPIGGASVALSGPYFADTGGFEVSGSYIDGSGNTVPVVISGNLPGPTGSVPVNVYVGNDPNDVFVAMLSAGMLSTPTPTPSVTPGPAGEPRIVYAAPATSGLAKIFLLNSDGTNPHRLTTGTSPVAEINPAWSPDGSKIAFAIPEGSGHAIAVANPDGSGLDVLTEGGLYRHPAWSPDGSKISFAISTDAIAVMNADGSGRHELIRRLSGDEYGKMSWSPDGTKIAFESTRGKSTSHDQDYEIFVMNAADGSGLMQLTSNAVADHSPAWKPDGTKIAFHTKRPTVATSIWLMNPDGSAQAQLVGGGSFGVSEPAWSQDGTEIAYGGFFFGISIANADGTGARTVANTMFFTDFDLR